MFNVLVRGSGDVGSAVAYTLFAEGYGVVLHDSPKPPHSRRGMAFCDALFDGNAVLAGKRAKRARDAKDARHMLPCGRAIAISDAPLDEIIAEVAPDVLVDARMRKRAVPESQRGFAYLSVGLGPNFTAGLNADVVVETGWGDDLGRVITAGSARPLAGDPRDIDGFTRERFIYAPADGIFRTALAIGASVAFGEPVAVIGETPLFAPMAGVLRGLTHDGARVEGGMKVLEVDPRGDARHAFGLGDRPRKIALGVLSAVRQKQVK